MASKKSPEPTSADETAADQERPVEMVPPDLGQPADPQTTDLASELAAQQERVLRIQAEMQNLRQRQIRELNDERKYSAIPVVRDLLPVLDNVDRAIEAANTTQDAASLLQGLELIRQQLQQVLAQHNCSPINALGEVFDPNLHEAILQQPSDEHPAGTVIHVTETGYQLHDRVVRPTQVIVSSGASASKAS